MTPGENNQNSIPFYVSCGEDSCNESIPVLAQSVTRVVRSGLQATVTVDLSPAAGKEPVRRCKELICGRSFASMTTEDPSKIAWLEEHVNSDRIDIVDESVVVLRRRYS